MVTETIEGFRLDGQLAVVTGASKGLGQGCALALAGAGADVALIGRNQDDLVAVAKEIQQLGRTAHVLAIDVTNCDDLAAMLGKLPPFQIFVNNAGTNRPQPFLEVDAETYDMVMNLNLRAAFFAAQAAARLMAGNGHGGSIINMSSQAGHRALLDRSVYSTSKFALEGLTKAMAFELAEQSIRVNAVAPTFVETPMTQAGLSVFVRNKQLSDRSGVSPARTVLFVHGATYPSTVTFDYAIDGESWMDIMARAGFDVWCVDLLGYGASDRPAEMSTPAGDNPPVVGTVDAVADVTKVIDFILAQRQLPRLALIGYSWGTMICGTYAGQQPRKVERLVLYGCAWMGTGRAISTGQMPGAYRMVDAAAAIARWCRELDDGQIASIASPAHMAAWAEAFLATDPESVRHDPPQARAPAGVVKDVQERLQSGVRPYDPGLIAAPTMIVVGEWDRETRPEQGRAAFGLLSNDIERRYVMIGGATHSMLIENQRGALQRAVDGFLQEGWMNE